MERGDGIVSERMSKERGEMVQYVRFVSQLSNYFSINSDARHNSRADQRNSKGV